MDAPHAERRRTILQRHPNVAKLAGCEWRSKWICFFALVVPQIGLSIVSRHMSWPVYAIVAYVVGATLTQALFLAIHELAHNLFFVSSRANRLFSIVANLPVGIPFAIAFRVYHLDHHRHQGVDGIDTDLPSEWETRHVRGPLSKLVWCSLQIVAYAVRPCIERPLSPWTTPYLLLNVVVQVLFDSVMYGMYGGAPLVWMVVCVLLAGGLHPCAGHFVSEHYVFPHKHPTQETYSYYGPLNRLTWNVGYHNEHHDFPSVPWSRLPTLHGMAREHYETLASCESWCGVLRDYVCRPEVGPWSRVRRTDAKKK